MCKLCETNPVYEFTNKRKLCKRCFVNYFNKKFLFTLRKYELIKSNDKIYYLKNNNSVKSVVLEKLLYLFLDKCQFNLYNLNEKKPKGKDKIALNECIDDQAKNVFSNIIHLKSPNLKKFLPKDKNYIRPLYFFLEEEIILYAKLNGLKFIDKPIKKDKIDLFLDELQIKHPEVKRAVVNSLLKIS
jgi:tRNA(Ile)-lysidine synthase TilS/MesJ